MTICSMTSFSLALFLDVVMALLNVADISAILRAMFRGLWAYFVTRFCGFSTSNNEIINNYHPPASCDVGEKL